MKGIILAGGSGTRLYPMTTVMTKQLQPVYDKPMIYYPLSLLMLGGIRDILIITAPEDQKDFYSLLGDGSKLGIKLEYAVQPEPEGIPQAFIIGEEFIGDSDVCLILGDNIFHGELTFFKKAVAHHKGARIFAINVADPEAFGVIELEKSTNRVLSIEEKPAFPKSSYAIPGLYIFDSRVCKKARMLKPSGRNETEIIDLISSYKDDEALSVEVIGRGITWLDAGTPKTLLEASNLIHAIEDRQGLKVACLEEIAFRMNYIDEKQLWACIDSIPRSQYRSYLETRITES